VKRLVTALAVLVRFEIYPLLIFPIAIFDHGKYQGFLRNPKNLVPGKKFEVRNTRTTHNALAGCESRRRPLAAGEVYRREGGAGEGSDQPPPPVENLGRRESGGLTHDPT
jgi:hypothetical protein